MRCIDDLINGNLTDAKVGAVNKSAPVLLAVLEEDYGYSPLSARAAVAYLKGKGSFQAMCDQLDRDNKAKGTP